MMANNNSDNIGRAAFPIDLELGAVPDIPNPEYTINDIYFLLFSLPTAYCITFGLAPFIDGPDLDAPDATWADPKVKLRLIIHFGAAVALVIRLLRFGWMHRGDVCLWLVGNLGNFPFAYFLLWVLRPVFPEDVALETRLLAPWTTVGSLLAYVTYRLRQPEKVLKQ